MPRRAVFSFILVALAIPMAAVAGLREIPDRPTPPTTSGDSRLDAPRAPEVPAPPRIVVLDADTLPPSPPRTTPKPDTDRLRVVDKNGDTTEIAWDFKKRGAKGKDVDLVRFGEDILIDEDQEIEGNVVSVGGNVEVRGRVHGDVVSIGGRVRVRPNGAVDGDVVSMGGQVDKSPGAHIRGSDVGLRLLPGLARHLPFGRAPGFLARAVGSVVVLAGLFLLGWVLDRLARRRVRSVTAHLRDHLWSSLFVGIGVLILAGPAFVLLLVTVIGIPLAALLPFLVLLGLASGYLVVATMVGQRVLGGEGDDGVAWIKGMVAGLAICLVLFTVGDIVRAGPGVLHAMGIMIRLFTLAAVGIAATTGLGSIVLTRGGKREVPPELPRDDAHTPYGDAFSRRPAGL